MIKFKNLFARKKKEETFLYEDKPVSTRKAPLETLKAKGLAKNAIQECENLIIKFGDRLSGSSSCLETANSLNDSLREYCDFTSKQLFKHKGKAFTLWIKLLPFIYIINLVLLLFGFPLTALFLYIIFIYYIYREYIVYKPIGENLVKESDGCNIHGVIEPKGEVLNTIIFSSHHDSALIPSIDKKDTKNYFVKVTLPLILFGASAFCLIVQLIVEIVSKRIFSIGFPPISSIVFILLLLMSSYFVFPLQKYFSKEGSLGAGDNLISSTMLIQIARYFKWKKDTNRALKNTRLIFCSFDAEEVGLRGSKVWFDKHEALLINPIMINFDCLYKSNNLIFIENDINGTEKLSSKLAQRGVKLATSMGYKAKMDNLPFLSGGTDAAQGYRARVEAVTLMALDFNHLDDSYFHTRFDTVDKIEEKAIEQAISIAIKLSNSVDSGSFEDDEIVKNEKIEETVLDLSFSKLTRK